MNHQLHRPGVPPQPAKNQVDGMIGIVVAAAVAGMLLLLGIVIGVAAGWPTFGLWIAGFVPVVYGVIQLFLRRGRRGLATIGAGLLAGIVAFATIPGDAGTVAEPAAITTTTQPSSAADDTPARPSPSTSTTAPASSPS